MSTDNGIYILKTEQHGSVASYRVANIHAIENLFKTADGSADMEAVLSAFAGSPELASADEALSFAEALESNLLAAGLDVEYGILFLDLEKPNCLAG